MAEEVFGKVKFLNPKKSQVVIFDNTGSEVLEKMVVSDIDHAILHSRGEVLYITPQILFGILNNMKYLKAMRQGDAGHDLIKSLRKLFGSLYRVYLLTCIQYIKPKVVMTFIDNSFPFQLISRIYKDAQFIALQNGVRIRDCLKDSRPPFPQPGSIISMPMLVCFGNHDVDSFRKYHHQIDQYYPMGSLRARYYRAFVSKPRSRHEFDLCLISEWDEGIFLGNKLPVVKKGIVALDDFLSRYMKERKVTLCIASRSKNKEEEAYFLNKYGSQITFIRSNRETMSSYDAVDRSAVTVTFYSTLGREAFGWGARVLSCNLSGDDQFDFPCPGFWSITEADYGLFRGRLDHILSLKEEEYQRQTKESAAYIMNNSTEKAPHEFVREFIFKQLHGPAWT
jgi:surface carbohydrate biosynthesis protein